MDSGANSPCPFDITFTGAGEVTITTYYDNNGTPIRQSVHGALVHTFFSAWHTLVSNGPAPVHVDLSTGQMVITGKQPWAAGCSPRARCRPHGDHGGVVLGTCMTRTRRSGSSCGTNATPGW